MAGKIDDDGDGGLSDAEWEEFERSFTKEATKTATYKEPSARQRELTAKWKKEAPKDTGWRTDGPAADLTARNRRTEGGSASEPAASGGAGGRSARRGGGWRRSRAWAVAKPVLVVVAVVAVVVGSIGLLGAAPEKKPEPQPLPFGGTVPGSAAGGPTAAKVYAHPDDQFFDGSPSIGWANGADGIVAPAAQRIGNYSEKTVGDAYAALRQMMITADLDPKVMAGADPQAVFALLDSRDDYPRQYRAAMAKPSQKDDATGYVTRFNPRKVQLLGSTVKVNGTMTAKVAADGSLLVTADYRFVYALAALDSGQHDRSMVRRALTLQIGPGDQYDRAGHYFISERAVSKSNDVCGIYDGFINPAFDTDGGVNTGKIVDPYAASTMPVVTQPSGECDGTKPI